MTAALDVDPAVGLPAARARQPLSANGPNALPEEKPKPGWRRFAEEYRAYMQIILVAAAVVSLLVKEWSTETLSGDKLGRLAARRWKPATAVPYRAIP